MLSEDEHSDFGYSHLAGAELDSSSGLDAVHSASAGLLRSNASPHSETASPSITARPSSTYAPESPTLEPATPQRGDVGIPGHPDLMQARLEHEIVQMMGRWQKPIFVITVTLMLLVVLLVGCYIWAMYVVYKYGGSECDVPLKKYVIASVSVALLSCQIRKAIHRRFPGNTVKVKIGVALVTSIPSIAIMCYGLHLIFMSETCAQTNARLFFAVEHLIYIQLVAVASRYLLGMGFVIAAVRNGWLSAKTWHAGCAASVAKLPKVLPNSPELLAGGEGGEPAECPICCSPFAGPDALNVVRTPCAHLFHEMCLSQWCVNSNSCPVCRGVVDLEAGDGEADVGSFEV